MREDLGPLFLWTKNLTRSKIRILGVPQVDEPFFILSQGVKKNCYILVRKMSLTNEEPQNDQETYQLHLYPKVCSMVITMRNPMASW